MDNTAHTASAITTKTVRNAGREMQGEKYMREIHSKEENLEVHQGHHLTNASHLHLILASKTFLEMCFLPLTEVSSCSLFFLLVSLCIPLHVSVVGTLSYWLEKERT